MSANPETREGGREAAAWGEIPAGRWQVFYWMRIDGAWDIDNGWRRTIVGEVEAPDIDEALRLAREEFGDYRELGYRLRARRAVGHPQFT